MTETTGHNSQLTDAEKKALVFHHFGAIQAQKEAVEVEKAEYKRLRKLAKADGIALADIDFMLKCAEVDDESIIPSAVARQVEILGWFSMLPAGTQLEMFGGADDRTPAVDRADADGYAAGFAGKSPENPHGLETEQGQAWMAGWHRAQGEMRDALASAMEKKARPDSDEDGGDPFGDGESNLEAAE